MSSLLWIAAALLGTVDDLYRVEREGDRVTISADRSAVSCERAMLELGTALAWRVAFEPPALRARLAAEVVDLSFTRQGPRTIARLVAIAAGADAVFETDESSGATRVIVVATADSRSPAGRERLRRRAIQWYRTFLGEGVPHAIVDDQSLRARMDMARLLMKLDAFAEAATVFQSVARDDPDSRHAPPAMLRVAECLFELGPERWREAEHWARELSGVSPGLQESAAATVLLGRILIASGRPRECVKTLQSAYVRLVGTPAIVDLYLAIAEAQFRMGEPEELLATLRTLRASQAIAELDDRRVLDYLFLWGYGQRAAEGDDRDAIAALQLFVGASPEHDPRKRIAWVLLGEALLEEGSFVAARAAALHAKRANEARADRDRLVGGDRRRWERAATVLSVRIDLLFDDEDRTLRELEARALRDGAEDPELILFASRTFHQRQRFQKAIEIADLLTARDDAFGERALLRRIHSMWERASRDDAVERFPVEAMPFARRIADSARQREVAAILGAAHERLGRLEDAMAAYQGLLQ